MAFRDDHGHSALVAMLDQEPDGERIVRTGCLEQVLSRVSVRLLGVPEVSTLGWKTQLREPPPAHRLRHRIQPEAHNTWTAVLACYVDSLSFRSTGRVCSSTANGYAKGMVRRPNDRAFEAYKP